jgi:transposase
MRSRWESWHERDEHAIAGREFDERLTAFMVSIGVAARVCKPYTPQTKGKVERSVSHVKRSLWAGITFTDLDDLNRQAKWGTRKNQDPLA